MNFFKNQRMIKVLALFLIITTLIGLVSVASFAEDEKANTAETETTESTVKVDDIDDAKYEFKVDGVTYLKTGDNTVAVIGIEAVKEDGKTFTFNEVKDGEITYKVTAIYDLSGIGTKEATVIIGENVTTIGANALSGRQKVTVDFTKPENIKVLGENALKDVSLNKFINELKGLTSVGKNALAVQNEELKADKDGFVLLAEGTVLYKYEGDKSEVTLPATVTAIADGAFAGNTTVTKVNLNKATKIGNDAFNGCTALETISSTDNVNYVGKNALLGTKFYANLSSESDGFCRISNTPNTPGNKVLVKYTGSATKIDNIPGDIEFIYNAFDAQKETLVSVVIGVNVKGICDGCFEGFTKLTSIVINNSSEGQYLTIGAKAFANTPISSFTVPAQVKTIAGNALEGCSNLKTVLVRNRKGWEAAGGGFYTETENLTVSFARYSTEQQTLSKQNDAGLMYYINMFFGWILRFCSFASFGIYLIALFLFALIMKILLFPFGIKQQKGMIKQANFRPKEMAIHAKYRGRNDRATQQKMQQEIMEARQKENIGMMSGCLPMLLQLPILFILYNVIMNPLRYICGMTSGTISVLTERCKEIIPDFTGFARGDVELVRHLRDNWSEFEGLEGLSGFSKADLPNFSIGGLDLSEEPYIGMTILVLIPILTFVISYFSMKLTRKFSYQAPSPNGQDEAVSLKIMDFAMPALSTWIAFSVPAVIGCYWIFQNVLSTVQQWVLSKLYPLPVFTEEDYKKAERELMGKQPKVKPGSNYDPNRPKVRSLHHIDDDEDDLPPRRPDAVRDDEEDDENDKPQGGNSKIGRADLQ